MYAPVLTGYGALGPHKFSYLPSDGECRSFHFAKCLPAGWLRRQSELNRQYARFKICKFAKGGSCEINMFGSWCTPSTGVYDPHENTFLRTIAYLSCKVRAHV